MRKSGGFWRNYSKVNEAGDIRFAFCIKYLDFVVQLIIFAVLI
jgi:hypothetical protein